VTRDEKQKIFRIVVGLLLGLVSASIVFFGLIGISFSIGLFGWGDGGDPVYLRRLELTTEATLVISAIVSLLVAFLIARKIIKSGAITID